MKTIKELSKSLNISKVSLYKLVKRDDMKGHVFKKDGVSVVDDIGEQLIKNHYQQEQSTTMDDIVNDTVNQSVNQLNDDIIALLQEQLIEKDNQINSLLNIVVNQQKFQATQYIVDKGIDGSYKTPPMKESTSGFFARIFKRKQNK